MLNVVGLRSCRAVLWHQLGCSRADTSANSDLSSVNEAKMNSVCAPV